MSAEMEAFVVIPVYRWGDPRPSPIDLAPVVEYFEGVSAGTCRLAPVVVEPVAVEAPLSTYGERGGLGRYPRNSQALLEKALRNRGPLPLPSNAVERVLLVVHGEPFRAHTWSPRGKALRVCSDRYCRRYALVTARASTTIFCHELGHLLFGWPDLARVPHVRGACLMGAPDPRSDAPPWPCAPLRVLAGWTTPRRADRTTRVRDVHGEHVWLAHTLRGSLLVERGREGLLRLWEGSCDAKDPLRRLVQLDGRAIDEERPLLAFLRDAYAVLDDGAASSRRSYPRPAASSDKICPGSVSTS